MGVEPSILSRWYNLMEIIESRCFHKNMKWNVLLSVVKWSQFEGTTKTRCHQQKPHGDPNPLIGQLALPQKDLNYLHPASKKSTELASFGSSKPPITDRAALPVFRCLGKMPRLVVDIWNGLEQGIGYRYYILLLEEDVVNMSNKQNTKGLELRAWCCWGEFCNQLHKFIL